MKADPQEIIRTAKTELEAERFRKAVDAEKERLKKYIPIWDRIFPWQITLKIKRKHDTSRR